MFMFITATVIGAFGRRHGAARVVSDVDEQSSLTPRQQSADIAVDLLQALPAGMRQHYARSVIFSTYTFCS